MPKVCSLKSFSFCIELHAAAKETVTLAEQRFVSKQDEWQFDSNWQEVLNHAIIKVRNINTQIKRKYHSLNYPILNTKCLLAPNFLNCSASN